MKKVYPNPENTTITPFRQLGLRRHYGEGGGCRGQAVKTVAVAMSGGVDSSVSAALLKEQGCNVVGFFMKNWGDDTRGLKKSDCPWVEDREDAMAAAAKLDIPFHTLDFEEEYKNQVLDYFFKEYEKGRTPNPDIMCNARIKFGVFLEKSLEMGADMIATGHYARLAPVILSEAKNPVNVETSGIYSRDPSPTAQDDVYFRLLKARDQNKDQTYFLYRLTQQQLSKSMFPIGGYTKPEVREMAKKFGLPNHDKKDSQGVCFIGHLDLKEFLSQKIKNKKGDIVASDGQKIGTHDGLFSYTIGQRKGINVGGTGPYYVVRKDFKNNELIVTNNSKDEHLYSSEVIIEDVNWIVGSASSRDAAPRASAGCECRIRYREKLTKCEVKPLGRKKYSVKFKIPQWAIASGQSVVFYNGDACLGGGIIE